MGGCDVALKLGSGPSHLPGYLFELILELGSRSVSRPAVRGLPMLEVSHSIEKWMGTGPGRAGQRKEKNIKCWMKCGGWNGYT